MKKLSLLISSFFGALLLVFSFGVVLASTNQDFKTDVKSGLLSLRSNPTAQADKTAVENGENKVAGDENNKNIQETDIEKEVEQEIETEKKTSTDKPDNPDTNTSTKSSR